MTTEAARFLVADLKKLRDEVALFESCIEQERRRQRPNSHAIKVLQAMRARNNRIIYLLERVDI